jgi:hypothetical protein
MAEMTGFATFHGDHNPALLTVALLLGLAHVPAGTSRGFLSGKLVRALY